MKWFINLNLMKKIMIVSALMAVAALCWSSFNSYKSYISMIEAIETRNQYMVESAYSLAEGMKKRAERGEMSVEQAQSIAKSAVRAMRYENNAQYFWINDTDGQAVMHPLLPELEGGNLQQKNPKVHALFSGFAKALSDPANQGGMIYNYDWPKPGQDKALLFPKSSYIKLYKDWGWVIGTGVYVDDVNATALKTFYVDMGFCVAFLLFLIVGTYFATQILSKPLFQLASNMRALAAGDMSVAVPYADRKDEVGLIAQAFGVFKEAAIEKAMLEQRQIELQKDAERAKKVAMQELADAFEQRTSGLIADLGRAAGSMSDMSARMQGASVSCIDTTQTVAQDVTQTNASVQTVAAATEELVASIQEISRQISEVSSKSGRSAQAAAETETTVRELDSLANSIGTVVAAIKGIADQTSLLALNATIEAARAGEAGKGFSVVADEVKKLATETSAKTAEIDEQVLLIQTAIRNTVAAVGEILTDVKNIDHATATVASAVEEQNAATSEISRNVNNASSLTQNVTDGVNNVADRSEEVGELAGSVRTDAENLSILSQALRKEVDGFLSEIRG